MVLDYHDLPSHAEPHSEQCERLLGVVRTSTNMTASVGTKLPEPVGVFARRPPPGLIPPDASLLDAFEVGRLGQPDPEQRPAELQSAAGVRGKTSASV